MSHHLRRRFRAGYARLALLLLALAACVPPSGRSLAAQEGTEETAPPGRGETMPPPTWEEIDRLVSEQKMQQALDRLPPLLDQARRQGDDETWARALVKGLQLRVALQGFETAVRTLHQTPWPKAPRERALLDLFYAQSLLRYLQTYRWEIDQRERVVSSDQVDLKAWTREQIAAEIDRAQARVWAARERWGDRSLGTFGAYLEQNDYPARIRGTLRDTIAYLWVELLADSGLWRPAEANEVYRLDAAALIAGDAAASAALDLTDPTLHPLRKLGAVLDDLEAWHRAAERPEAALEARLERLQRLAQHLTQDHHRAAIRDDLARHLERLGRAYPWWSMGMATLAEQQREVDRPDALARALATARAGAQAHPLSPGGRRCRHLAAVIEAPAYQLSAMAVDGPRRRSIEISHSNLETLHFRAYALDLEALLGAGGERGVLPGQRQVPAILRSQQPAQAWTETLPQTGDYRVHRSFLTPPLEAPGLYLVVASARGDFAERGNQLQAVTLFVSDLVLIRRSREDRHQITVRSGLSGEPLAGTELVLYRLDYRQGNHRPVGRETADAEGRAVFRVPPEAGGQHVVLARRGDDAVLDLGRLTGYRRGQARSRTSALVYTDRSVYRPGQTVQWKVVAYRDAGGGPNDEDGAPAAAERFRTLAGAQLTVELLDANGQVVAEAEAESNDYGSAAGSFTVPAAGHLLGSWQLRVSLGGGTAIQVEEYKRPTFEVAVEAPAEVLRLNREATLRGHARYYFGLPVTAGEVAWRITREPVFPPWWLGHRWPPGPPVAGRTQVVAAGRAALDAEGAFTVAFTPAADPRLDASPELSFRYRLAADVTDQGGETRSASRVFRIGFVAVEAGIAQDGSFVAAGTPARLTVERRDLDGDPRAGDGSWRLLALAQPERTLLPAEQPLPAAAGEQTGAEAGAETPGDRLRPRWAPAYDAAQVLRLWDDGEEVARGTVEHGEDGAATVELGTLPAGAYRLRYRTVDPFGAAFETGHELLVAGDGGSLQLPAVLRAERGTVAVGDTARILVHSGLAEQPMVLEVIRGADTVSRTALTGGGAPRVIELPVTDADRGGFSVRLSALRDHQLMILDEQVLVPWDNRALELEFTTFRDRLRPGEEDTWTLTVRGAEGALAAGAAELLAYMYDKSLDLFAAHHPPRPLDLYPTRGQPRIGLRSNLGTARRAWQAGRDFVTVPGYPTFTADRLTFFDGIGIGGPGRGGEGRLGQFQRMSPMAAGAPKRMAMPMAAEADGIAESAVVSDIQAAAEPPASPPPEAGEPAADELRRDFSETAFWLPQLLTGDDGSVRFTFTVPDAVTEWNVWVHALSRDLRAGSVNRQTRSAKELLVRPYLPRFLREGDRAAIRVVVDNAGETPQSGRLDFSIVDPETGADLGADFALADADARDRPFQVAAGSSTALTVPLRVPARVGPVAFRVIGRAGDLSDGELRLLPVLPGRVHLMQSRFAALRGEEERQLVFDDLVAGDDPTRIDQQLVVTLDAQLFYGVLAALPYLVDYPYHNAESILNRFLSTGILSSLFERYPAVASMAAGFAERDTRLEVWPEDDPNRTMALEETPWLETARGGAERDHPLIKVLDPAIARATRDTALARLQAAQYPDGAFPWSPGGPPSPYVTLYVMYGFAKALEFGVEVPQEMAVRGWSYLREHYQRELLPDLAGRDCCWPLVTFLNYVLSCYPDVGWTGGVWSDDDRRRMLDTSFRAWRDHPPLSKGHLALTLARAGRGEDARLVWDSVMDSARTTRDEGTFWQPEERAWLWYHDTIDSHAFALRVLGELDGEDPRRAGLVQWLMLNKQLNHWRSTRATAEVIYALAHYLRGEQTLAIEEAATIAAGEHVERFTFAPDRYTGGGNRLVLTGDAIDPQSGRVTVRQETPGLMFASATWHFSTERLPRAAEGDLFHVERRYFERVQDGDQWTLVPLAEGTALDPGDQLEVQLTIRARHAAEYVHLRDPRGAGFEPERPTSGYRFDLGIGYYEEVRDSGTNFFFSWLPAGEYTLRYRLRANLGGRYNVAPATLQSLYAPEFAAYSAGDMVQIGDGGGP